jgi:hypothetical protein
MRRSLIGFAESFDIGHVLCPTAGEFVSDEALATNQNNRQTFNFTVHARIPRFLKRYAVDFCEDVNPRRRQPKLENSIPLQKAFLKSGKVRESEIGQCALQSRRVLCLASKQEGKIASISGVAWNPNAHPLMRRYSTPWAFNNSINSLKSWVSFIGGRHDFEHELKFLVSGQGAIIRVVSRVGFRKAMVHSKFALWRFFHAITLYWVLTPGKF